MQRSAPGDTAADDRIACHQHMGDHCPVGMPPSISCAGCACATHRRRPGRRVGMLVTTTRNCAGITSSRSEMSADYRHARLGSAGHAVIGRFATSIRGRWAGSAPRLARRLAALSVRSSIMLSPLRHLLWRSPARSLRGPTAVAPSGRRSDLAPKCRRLSCSSR